MLTKTSKKPKKRMPRVEREERMLDAANEIFARDQFRGASIDEIADRSGITKPLIYRYFGSKEGLYEACVQRQSERAFERIEGATREVEGVERIAVFVREYVAYLAEHRDTWWLLYADASSAATERMRRRNAGVVERLLADTFTEMGRDVPSTSVQLLSRMLAGAGEEMGRWWDSRPDVSQEQATAQFQTIATGAIAAVLADSAGRS